LNPEELTLLDPACGSGHILVEAYDLCKAIYQERGYRARDIPTLILQKNLFGLEIDDRAAQLAAFALLMKARADDRRIFASGVQPNVLAIQESKGLNAKTLTEALNVPLAQGERAGEKGSISPVDVADLINLFEHGKTFGSLIQVPPTLAEKLPAIGHRVRDVLAHGDLMTQPAAKVLLPLIEQAWMLSRQYDAVVANPPYMGLRYCNAPLKSFLKDNYRGFDKDLFSAFVAGNKQLTAPGGYLGFMMPFVWMFISSHETLRELVLNQAALTSLIQLEYSGFAEATVPICTFTLQNKALLHYTGSYIRLTAFRGAENQGPKTLEAIQNRNCGWFYTAKQSDFRAIPGRPIAYWISERMRQCFRDGTPLGTIALTKHGMTTGNNDRFLRCWFETVFTKIGFLLPSQNEAAASGKKWFPYNKGGEYRRWYGNNTFVVNYQDRGRDMKAACDDGSNTGFRHDNPHLYFRPALTWSFISSSFFAVRCSDAGFLFDVAGSSAFPPDEWRECIAGFLCSNIAFDMMKVLNPTMNFQVGNVAALPILQPQLLARKSAIEAVVREAVQLARTDWDSFETSWDFQTLPVLRQRAATLSQSQAAAAAEVLARFQRMKQLEEENNRLFIEAYGLQDELSPEVPEDQITLARPDRKEDIKRLISYAIGCVMGRYKPRNTPRNTLNTQNTPPNTPNTRKGEEENLSCDSCVSWSVDPDAIVPIMDTDWFPDDAANRFVEFIGVAWPDPSPQPSPPRGEGALLEENLTFVAESLGPNRGEQPRETIRRYLAQSFFKDHLKTYKRRPIYWLFTSGKQRVFQCLVYLHRYHEGTLSRMRTEYVIPLQGKINARIEQLASDIQQATSTSHRKKLEKEQDTLRKQQVELQAFDEKLRHYADMRISLDLDDGVKVNYGKFGDLLAEVKAVCGE
jgi:hypothetical protein